MNKIKVELNQEYNPDDIISKLKAEPLLKNIDVNLFNLNDCLLLVEENKNCRKCKSLDDCLNSTRGYCTKYIDDSFILSRCKYKIKEDELREQNNLIKTLFMPKTIREASLEDFKLNTEERRQAYQKAVNFITNYENEKKGLFIYGNYGSGKTYLLAAIANELAARHVKTLLIYFPDLIRELKDSIRDDSFSSIINELKNIDVLMLDDLGSENMTSFVRDDILGPILNYRMAEKKPVFISSNLTPEQLIPYITITNTSIDQSKAIRILTRIQNVCEIITLGRRKFDANN